MNQDYLRFAQLVADGFGDQLGPRLQSIFIRGSVARGDAVWGVSDLDLVLWFDRPTAADNQLKGEVDLQGLPGGSAVVLQRLDRQRLDQMDEATRAYWCVSSLHDSRLIRGMHPAELVDSVPEPPRLANLLTPVIIDDGDRLLARAALTRAETRRLAKRTLNLLSMPAVASGLGPRIPPRAVGDLDLPAETRPLVPAVTAWYDDAPSLADPAGLQRAWTLAREWVRAQGL
ncbi:nucleotidyltransferase family protein [Microlunatus parietis]|uniref:Nucleotidyltransferase domain-containing protein n=1 Tax=Microlunatus parietis TaxID=682979 RepID=A0A7Y9LEC6_9ACTN|nr:hypothetical protein [Microlunatus parietis]NYE72916.1 hypothetical protein [Microlunatus parietis]